MRKTLLAAVALSLIIGFPSEADPARPALDYSATPDLPCGPNDRPETIQGRVPLADYESGRADLGYTCNSSKVSQVGSQEGGTGADGGYRVYRYVDKTGQVCGYYDTTLLFPANMQAEPSDTGVWVLDMSDPMNPVHLATLSTPAMQSPHESFSINLERGLLGAVFANPAFYHGQFDLYSISEDCLHPFLQSSLPMRLAVNNPEHQNDPSQANDPNATNSLQGYRAHYCAVPSRNDPQIVACSFILSGLRVFDISNLLKPVEIAYFNMPATVNGLQGPQGAYAMSQPAFDMARQQIWYSDGNSGFYVVQIESGVWPKCKHTCQ